MAKKFVLTGEQRAVIKAFLKFLLNPNEKYLIIQGAAGTGKTTLIAYLLEALEKQYKLFQMLLCKDTNKGDFETMLTATTNKAVSVLRDLTKDEVRTIHSSLALKVVPDFKTGETKLAKTNEYRLLFNKVIIVDEASMMDDRLFKVLDETACDCKVVLIGDQYQLAPVKQRASIMETLNCPKVVMSKVMRHAGAILHTATIFRETVETGMFQDIPIHDNVTHVDGPTFKKRMDAAFLSSNYKTNKAKVLAWSNGRVQEYNHYIRQAKGFPEHFEKGEIVITNNPVISPKGIRPVDSEVVITYIGSPITRRGVKGCYVELDGKIEAFLPLNYLEVKTLLKTMAKRAKAGEASWRDFFTVKEGWLDLRPAYASTVHKSQGSSYGEVLIDLSDIGRCNFASDVARMLYVAISRATDEVILYGSLPPRYRSQMAA